MPRRFPTPPPRRMRPDEPSIVFPNNFEHGFEAILTTPPGTQIPDRMREIVADVTDLHAEVIRGLCTADNPLGRCVARSHIVVRDADKPMFSTTEVFRVVCSNPCDSTLPKVPLSAAETPVDITQAS